MSDEELKKRVRWAINRICKNHEHTNKTLASLLGVNVGTLSNYRTMKNLPKASFIVKLCELFECNKEWLMTGKGRPFYKTADFYEDENSSEEKHLSGVTSIIQRPAAAMLPAPDYSDTGVDPVIQAMSDIKDIFASGDPILIPAIQANLNAFKRALMREQQFSQVIKENKALNERITNLETLCGRIPELEEKIDSLQTENKSLRSEVNRLKATYENPGDGSGTIANTEKSAI